MAHELHVRCDETTKQSLYPYFFTQGDQHTYRIFGTTIGEATFNESGFLFSFPRECPREELIAIHKMLTKIKTHHDVDIDDTKAVIGYLADGSPVTVVRGFQEWLHFLDAAGIRSMEGVVVDVFSGSTKIATGILRHYELYTQKDAFHVSSCTIEANGLEHIEGELTLKAVF